MEAADSFWQAGSLQAGVQALKEDSAFRFIAESGVSAQPTPRGWHDGRYSLSEWVTMSVTRAQLKTSETVCKMVWHSLATVGSTSPFVGLFGTVWGILNALTAIGIAGQASIDKVAGPVGGADHDGTGSGRGGACGAGLQLADSPQQGLHGEDRTFTADLHGVLMLQASKIIGAYPLSQLIRSQSWV